MRMSEGVEGIDTDMAAAETGRNLHEFEIPIGKIIHFYHASFIKSRIYYENKPTNYLVSCFNLAYYIS